LRKRCRCVAANGRPRQNIRRRAGEDSRQPNNASPARMATPKARRERGGAAETAEGRRPAAPQTPASNRLPAPRTSRAGRHVTRAACLRAAAPRCRQRRAPLRRYPTPVPPPPFHCSRVERRRVDIEARKLPIMPRRNATVSIFIYREDRARDVAIAEGKRNR